MKVCLEPGCPSLTNTSRCERHERERDKARGTRQQRGYDAAHDKLRAEYQARMDAGMEFTCWRCGRLIDISAWDLGHQDQDRTRYAGPECVKCNRGTSTRR
jgi:5-methylcytosine-specific restriction endonuclease McrA